MKKFILGLLIGITVTAASSVYADEGLQKIEAYLRPSLPVTLDGNQLKLESSPVMVDGSTYLKLRDVAKVTGLSVNWNDSTQTVELGSTAGGKNVNQTEVQEPKKIEPVYVKKVVITVRERDEKEGGEFYFVESDGNIYVSAVSLRDPYEISWKRPVATFKMDDTVTDIQVSDSYSPGVDAFTINGISVFKLSLLGLTAHIEGDTLVIDKQQ